VAGSRYDWPMPGWISWLAWLAILASARSGRADDKNPTVSLGLTRAAGAEACITPHDLAARVEARLGRGTFVSAAQADLFIDARVVPAGRGWRATVAASRANGSHVGVRELSSPSADCHSLDDDLVLVVALVIDPLATERPRATASVAPVVHDLVYVPVAVPAPAPAWSFEARAATTILGGLLPALAPGLEAALVTTPPGAWPIELGVVATGSAHADDGGHGAEARAVLGSVALCPALVVRDRYRLQLCAGGAAGALVVRSHGLDPAGGGAHATGLLSARGRASVRIAGRLHAVLDLGVTVPLARRSLSYTALDPETLRVERHELADVAAVGWIASLGLGVQIR
jgi:hypothetical protein